MNSESLGYYLDEGMRPEMLESLLEYRDRGRPLGGFLTAVISNDFVRACGSADAGNKRVLHVFANFLYNEMPTSSWGSLEKYQAWLNKFNKG